MARRRKNRRQAAVGKPWPVGVPINAETIAEAQKEHDLYYVENSYAVPIIEDPDQAEWEQMGLSSNRNPANLRTRIRELAKRSPTAKRVLFLYRSYILGGKTTVELCPLEADSNPENKFTRGVNKRLSQKIKALKPYLTTPEMCNRLYRDGDLFIRRMKDEFGFGETKYRFVDPEDVIDEDGNELGGIETDPSDVVNVRGYSLCRQAYDAVGNPVGYEQYAYVAPEDMVHIKLDCDSTEKRGNSRLLSCIEALYKHRDMLINEVTLRQSQSAIVMVRKVAGGQRMAGRIMDAAKSQNSTNVDNYSGIERNRAGTVATTTAGVEIDFAHPDNNFSDAGPLLSVLLREVAKTTGFTFEQISCDTSEGSLASAMVAESPVMRMIEDEREFLSSGLEKLWLWLLEDESINFDNYEVEMKFPDVTTEDRLSEAQANNIGFMCKALSSKEMSRRSKADPEKMRAELLEEAEIPALMTNQSAKNPDASAKQVSSAGNASAGGTNQGSGGNAGVTDPGKQSSQNS